ncbi:MAG: AraC family transcriptional regulator [Verrucomicrobia bacterium]|nr:AraC family transcriptional regulator [Verrucomicrobiota bacterium]
MKSQTPFTWPQKALPRIRLAGRFPMGDNSRHSVYRARWHALHQHQYHAEFWLGRRRLRLQPGDVTLTPVGVVSRYALPENGFHLCLHFIPVSEGGARLALPVFWRPGVLAPSVTARLRHIMETFRQSQGQGAAARLARVASGAALQELLVWLAFVSARRETAPMGQAAAHVDRLLALIEERVAQALSVPELTAEVGLSQNYLARHFRERMGVTIMHYVLNRRIELARHLLTTTRLPVKAVGAAVGYPDAQHFNKQFRRLTGLSPSAARALMEGAERKG